MLLPDHADGAVERRREQYDHCDDEPRPDPPFLQGLCDVHLGHHEPRRVRDGAQCRQHLCAAVIATLDHPSPAEHRHDRWKLGPSQGNAQLERRAVLVSQFIKEQNGIAVPADEQCLGRACRGGPGLGHLIEELFGLHREDDRADDRNRRVLAIQIGAGALLNRGGYFLHAGVAGALPARRAARIDPLSMLKTE